MVFNMPMETSKHPDAELIDALGGPRSLCQQLGWAEDGGVQRVTNWRARGIPAQVKLDYPHIFLSAALKKAAEKPSERKTQEA